MSLIHIFGPTTVEHDDHRLQGSGFGGRRPRQLLVLLALELGRPRSRDELAEAMWEGAPPHSYVATLHGYVCVLRRSLAAIGAAGGLVTVPGGYLLDPEQVTVDLLRGYEALATLDAAKVLDAIDLAARGLLLDDPYAIWATEARRRWDDALASAATEAASSATRSGENLTAIRLARAALVRTPYAEAALRVLMQSLAASGQVPQALECFHETRTRLVTDLGVRPQPETEQVYLELLSAGPVSGSDEVPVLVRLLRDALRNSAGIVPGADRAAWSDVGHRLLGQCS